MTDAEMFAMIRDLCVARTGSWSASGVLEHAYLLGFRARKTDGLAAVKLAIGSGNRRPGPRGNSVPGSVPNSVPGTELNSVPERKKRSKRKRDQDTAPSGTSYPPPPNFGDLETDVELFLAVVGEANKSGVVSTNRAHSLRRELQIELDAAPDRAAFAYGLRAANSAGAANMRYIRKAAANAPQFGSGASRNANNEIGSRNGSASSKYQDVSDAQREQVALWKAKVAK